MNLQTIILAAGQGTRMHSALPKVLHRVGGKTLLEHVYGVAVEVGSREISIVYGHGGDRILKECTGFRVHWIEQAQQLGTGHAVQRAAPRIEDDSVALILYGDVPLLKSKTVQALVHEVKQESLGLLTVELEDPHGYGRIVRDDTGRVLRIVEEQDASPAEQAIREVNTGILACRGSDLKIWLKQLDNANAQEEYYLTDIIGLAAAEGYAIVTTKAADPNEVLGVNNRIDLARLERLHQAERARMLMRNGVTLLDPGRFDLRGEVLDLGQDIEIDVNVILEGELKLGNRVRIGANSYIRDSEIADDVEILPNTVIENAIIGPGCRIGPFARIRPDSRLQEEVHIGNFVEIKKSTVAARSKINHLSYVGDSLVGRDVNIGAGTITCNYDGAQKHQTIIEDGAFIGSDTQLVAPVKVARNATIGAGSTITQDVPENTLTLSRARQVTIGGWQRPTKQEK